MDTIRVYFFSGAGHSFAVARGLAACFGGAEVINIVPLLEEETITDDAARIGFVFPVYGGMPPKFIRQWLTRFRPGEHSQVFAVCTCGIAPGHSLLAVDRILRSAGSRLSMGFAIKQPQAGIGSRLINTLDVVETCLADQKTKVGEIARHIQNGGPDVIEKSGRFSEFLNANTLTVLPTMAKLIGYLLTRGMKGMRFHPGAACNGCGICARLCPAHNIRMVDGRPQWGDNCYGCMACYHWCPENTVESVDLDMVQSPHREVSVGEMLAHVGQSDSQTVG